MTPSRPARRLAQAFAAYAIVAIPVLAVLMPPFQAADELAHLERANQIAHGGLLATHYAGKQTSGGVVDSGLEQAEHPFDPIRFHPERKRTRAMTDAASATGWGTLETRPFPNTALYPPLLYLPAASGQFIARHAGLSVLHGLLLSRLLDGLVSAALGALAIALSDAAAPFLFALLTLPMSLSLDAAVTQDGPLIAVAALASVLLRRVAERPHGPLLAGAALLLALTATARPAYLPLCLLPLLLPALPRAARFAAAGAAVLAVVAWTALVERVTLLQSAATQVSSQMQALSLHPLVAATLLRTTLHTQLVEGCPYCREFVGVLGWLDTPLPNSYVALAAAVLLGALAMSRPAAAPLIGRRSRLVAASLVLGAVVAVFVLQYLSWSPVGGPMVDGVQGRYFLPVAPFLLLLLPGSRARRPGWAVVALCCFPALSIAVTLRAIVFRYY